MLPFGTGANGKKGGHSSRYGSGFNVGGTIAIILMVFLLILVVSWFVYAYKNPTSRSGMWLIDVSSCCFDIHRMILHHPKYYVYLNIFLQTIVKSNFTYCCVGFLLSLSKVRHDP